MRKKETIRGWVVYITHLSILIILAGAIIGIFFGFNAFLNLPEGETTSVRTRPRY